MYTRGFTLVELIVTSAIITIILSVVMFNYGSFNDKLALSSAVQEMAITMRQAQAYGINVKEAGVNSNQFNYAYGIYFNSNTGSNTSYLIFIDSNNNYKYDSGIDQLVETLNLRNGVKITSVCDASSCPPSGYSVLHVSFLRPNPDARIFFTNNSGTTISGQMNTGKVQLSSPKGVNSYVIIENTGQIMTQ